jgi:hypothetical protein
MRIVRVVAAFREGGHSHKNYRFVLVCGIDANQHLTDGEWMAYIQNESIFWPFILKNGDSCFYGGEEHYAEPTNIGCSEVEVGRFFTLSSPPGEPKPRQSTYEIVSCHPHES